MKILGGRGELAIAEIVAYSPTILFYSESPGSIIASKQDIPLRLSLLCPSPRRSCLDLSCLVAGNGLHCRIHGLVLPVVVRAVNAARDYAYRQFRRAPGRPAGTEAAADGRFLPRSELSELRLEASPEKGSFESLDTIWPPAAARTALVEPPLVEPVWDCEGSRKCERRKGFSGMFI